MRSFGKAELEALKRDVDLAELVRSYGIELKRSGRSFLGLCPFHDDHNPSFSVDPKTNLWKCFGCGERGDAITFLRKKLGLSFPEALDQLLPLSGSGSGPNGGKLASRTPASERGKASREAGSEASGEIPDPERAQLLGAVVEHYEKVLEHSREGQSYLKRRGLLVPEVLKPLRVGYAGGSLLKAIAPEGEKRSKLTRLGVLLPDGSEAMTGMVVVPLLEPRSGAVLSLYGRAVRTRRHHYLPGELRGLVNAAQAMGAEELVVVESVLDAVSLLVLGIPNVLPIYGVNGWKKEHDQVLAEGAVKSVTFLLDSDATGTKAARALAERLSGRGLRLRIATLKEHKDPNEALVGGMTGEALRQVLAGAEVVHTPPAAVAPASIEATTRPETSYERELIPGGLKLSFGPRRYWARGLRGGGFEHLRVNLLLEDGYGEYRDLVDLYVGRSRLSFARRVARKFGFEEESLERELGTLARECELFLAEQARSEEPERKAAPELSEEEKAEALALLKDPRLLDLTVEHLGQLGYVGEETNKALGYLIVVSRKLEDPLSAIILSQSAAGKSGLTDVLEKVTPPEDVFLFSRLTPAALYYMPKDLLCRKVIIIEEAAGSEEADYSLRTLQSRKKLVLGVPMKDPRSGKTRTEIKEVDGPAVFLQTSTAIGVNHENSTRCFELFLDESVGQTERIHGWQRRMKTREGQRELAETPRLQRLHWNVQRLLRPVAVHIPFADRVTFPSSWLRTRRDNVRFLNLIEASAFLHQYQRPSPKGAEPGSEVEATAADYAVAYNLANEVLGATLHELRKPVSELLETMKSMAEDLGREKKVPPERTTLSRRDIRATSGLPDHQVRRLIAELVELEHIEQVRGGQGRTCLYRVPPGAGEPKQVLEGLLKPEEMAKLLEHRT